MAERARQPDSPEREIFELDKDERWQARLAEARARREVALREKAHSGALPKRKPKPWEVDEPKETAVSEVRPAPVIPDAEPRRDFADRMKALQKTIKRHGDNGGPPVSDNSAARPVPIAPRGVAEPPAVRKAPEPVPVATPDKPSKPSVADRYLEALSPEFQPVRPFVPDVRGPAEPSLPLTRTAGVPLVRDDAAPKIAEPVQDAEDEVPLSETEDRAPRRRAPALLLAGICLLALVPFTDTAPPREIGPPISFETPRFGLEPALGITRPMNAFPRLTMSWEWLPELNRATAGPLALDLEVPVAMQRLVAPFDDVGMGEGEVGLPKWSAIARAPDRARGQALVWPSLGGLPGVPDQPVLRRPEARPGDAPLSPAISDDRAELVFPEPLSLLRVTILLPSAGDLAEAEAIAENVLARGHELARIKPMDLKISESNVRFFHAKDRGEAERLANDFDARLRDFTSFRPRPKEGTVEVWLAGRSAETVRAPKVEAPATDVQQPTVIIIQRSPSLLDRLGDVLEDVQTAITP